MARDLELEVQKDDPVVGRKARTFTVVLSSPVGVDPKNYRATGSRHVVDIHQSGKVVAVSDISLPPVSRSFGEIAERKFTAKDCPTLTGAQLAAIISQAFDDFEIEDERKAAKHAAELAKAVTGGKAIAFENEKATGNT